MSTIIIMMGVLVLGLIVTVVVLWRHTHRELRHLRRELRATNQQLEIQRILIGDHSTEADGSPKRRRHLRALALIPLAPLLAWIREHRLLTAAGGGAVATAAAVAFLAPTGELAAPPHAAPPGDTQTSRPTLGTTQPTSTSVNPATTTTATPTRAPSVHTTTTMAPSARPLTTTPPNGVPSDPSGGSPSPPTTSVTPPEPPLGRPPGSGLCVVVDLAPIIELDVCLGASTAAS